IADSLRLNRAWRISGESLHGPKLVLRLKKSRKLFVNGEEGPKTLTREDWHYSSREIMRNPTSCSKSRSGYAEPESKRPFQNYLMPYYSTANLSTTWGSTARPLRSFEKSIRREKMMLVF